MLARITNTSIKTQPGQGTVQITASITYEVTATNSVKIAQDLLNSIPDEVQNPSKLLAMIISHATEEERNAVAASLALACIDARENLEG